MKITNEAKEFIEQILIENEPYQLRLHTVPGGCCKPSYGLSLGRAKETDFLESSNGVNIAVDSEVGSTETLTIDIKTGEAGNELILNDQSSCRH